MTTPQLTAGFNRWVIQFAPTIEFKARQIKRLLSSSWRVDETSSVPGVQCGHGSLNEPRVYLKDINTVAGANLCLWPCLVVRTCESERQ